MFGAFRATLPRSGGLLWKDPWRLSRPRKERQRERLKRVDSVIAAVVESGMEGYAVDLAKALPKESEMTAKEKYTVFSRKAVAHGYRKSVHKVPKWTRLTLRESPKGF